MLTHTGATGKLTLYTFPNFNIQYGYWHFFTHTRLYIFKNTNGEMRNSICNNLSALFKTVTKSKFRTLTTHVSWITNSKNCLLFSVYASQQSYAKHTLTVYASGWWTDRQFWSWNIHARGLHDLPPVVRNLFSLRMLLLASFPPYFTNFCFSYTHFI